MDYPFSEKERGTIVSTTETDTVSSVVDYASRSSCGEVSWRNFSELMNFDMNTGWCNNPSMLLADHMFASYGLSPFQSVPFAPLDSPNFTEQISTDIMPVSSSRSSYKSEENQQRDVAFDDCAKQNNDESSPHNMPPSMDNCKVSRPIGLSFDERMLTALSLLKDSSGGGILVQIWLPIKLGDKYILSTYDQPYLLDKVLTGYRELSRKFTFSTGLNPNFPLGLPGRVFTSKVPEWSSNVKFYSDVEYLRVNHAADHEVRGSIALPVFEPHDMCCCAVLELVTVKEKPNFDSEIEAVCHALEAVNLRSTAPPRLSPKSLSSNQRAALAEISDVLRAVCHAHSLPLALMWIPCSYSEDVADETSRVRVREDNNKRSDGKPVLFIEDTACYVNNIEMQGFVHACAEHYIEEGQGIAGKALQSNHPFFIPDVKTYDISEYPLVHHARQFGLNAAVAIRLRSIHTGNEDYVLEFFLPVHMKGSTEQQLLLNNLSGTMQRICQSLRTVSDAELSRTRSTDDSFEKMFNDSYEPIQDLIEADAPIEQVVSASRRKPQKKRSAAEKHVSLSVLQQYFSGSLKDAAKSIGVCPTTLKRICRQHGISRWPSRKINKVNRSLRKIKTVLDSVQGMEKGDLKYDPTTGGFVTSSSIFQKTASQKTTQDEKPQEKCRPKVENSTSGFVTQSSSSLAASDEMHTNMDDDQPSSSSTTNSSNVSGPSTTHGTTSTSSPNESVITVKATYKEDTVRFKFKPDSGCFHLYDEVASRFKLQNGTFQLKYLDDEDEWVLLVSNSDLQECVDILNDMGKRNVKFMVLDVPCGDMGSSGDSNGYLPSRS